MEARVTRQAKSNLGYIMYGYAVKASSKEFNSLINNEGFIPSFDKDGSPVIWTKRRLINAVVEITAKGRIVLTGEEV